VVVVGLGPAGPELLTDAARRALEGAAARFVRTTRHPAAVVPQLADARSFDDRYESAATMDEVYRSIAEHLVDAAVEHGRVAYAVPGSPLVAEHTVELLRTDERIVLEVVPALSFLDLAWTALGVDPVAAGVRLVDGQRFATEAAGERGPLLVGQCDRVEVLSAIKLAVEVEPDQPVTVLRRLGLPDEHVEQVAWADLDRSFTPDHLTTLWIPQLCSPVAAELAAFAELVVTLRAECPWDREQTHASLTRHLLEETYEVLEAIEEWEQACASSAPEGSEDLDDAYVHLQEELGDLLFQVFFHATLAAEEGRFTLADVARGIHDKLVSRHPAIFPPGGGPVAEADGEGGAPATAEEQTKSWEQLKKEEKGRNSVMEGIPSALPALLYAYKVQRKARSTGFAYPDLDAAADDVRSELAEVLEDPSPSEAGDLLFAATGVSVHLGIDPEAALRGAAGRFRDRFVVVEQLAAEAGVDLTEVDGATLDSWWSEAKRRTA